MHARAPLQDESCGLPREGLTRISLNRGDTEREREREGVSSWPPSPPSSPRLSLFFLFLFPFPQVASPEGCTERSAAGDTLAIHYTVSKAKGEGGASPGSKAKRSKAARTRQHSLLQLWGVKGEGLGGGFPYRWAEFAKAPPSTFGNTNRDGGGSLENLL